MELVTGRAGTPHITSQQDRQRNQGTFGNGAYILKTGNQLAPVVQSSNKIQIKDGALMFQGALFSVKVGTVDEVTIANGSQGMQRKDLIVARYNYDAGENVESAKWAVIQGTPAASNPVAPSYTEGDIQAGDTTVECPVLIATLDGINITGVEMVPEIAPDVPEIMAQLEELNSKMFMCEFRQFETVEGETWVATPSGVTKTLDQPVSSYRLIGFLCISEGTDGRTHRQIQWFPSVWLQQIANDSNAANKTIIFNLSRGNSDRRVFIELVQNNPNKYKWLKLSNDSDKYSLVVFGLK